MKKSGCALVCCFAYLIVMSVMLLHPSPWSLLGFMRQEAVRISRFSFLHLLVFLLLGMLVEWCRQRMSWERFATLALALTYSCAIECIQPLTGRRFELIDLAQNILGVVLGTILAALLSRLVRPTRTDATKKEN